MPCYDAWSDGSWHIHEDYTNRINKLQKRNDELARMLCGLCHAVQDIDIDSVPGLSRWWKEHKKFDEERKKNDR